MARSVGGEIRDIAYCPHHPPAVTKALKHHANIASEPGLLFELANKWQLDLRQWS